MEIYTLNTDFLQDKKILQNYLPLVSEYRRQKVDKLRFDKDKALSLGAGILLSFSLAKAGIDETSVVYAEGEHGKPYIVGEKIHFSLSHSGYRAALVWDYSECGIDIEQIKPYNQSVARRMYSQNEQIILEKHLENETLLNEYFTRIWTRKESYGKFTGQGLNFSDDIQKRVFDDRDMKERGIYFIEHALFDEMNASSYILSACSGNKEIFGINVTDIKSMEEIDCVIHRN